MSVDQNKNAPKDPPKDAPPSTPVDKQVTLAVASVCDALRELAPEHQRRVLSAVATVLGLNNTAPAARGNAQQQQRPNTQQRNGGR